MSKAEKAAFDGKAGSGQFMVNLTVSGSTATMVLILVTCKLVQSMAKFSPEARLEPGEASPNTRTTITSAANGRNDFLILYSPFCKKRVGVNGCPTLIIIMPYCRPRNDLAVALFVWHNQRSLTAGGSLRVRR